MVSKIPTPSPTSHFARQWRAESEARSNSSTKFVSIRDSSRILFVNQYYWPDHASTAQHLTDLAESLAAQGYDCHILCARSSYEPGAQPPPTEETHNGVHIHRVRATSLGRGNVFKRMADYLSFYLGAMFKSLSLPKAAVVVTLTTPPIIGLLGTILRRIKGSCQVYWSMDLHPDASLALGQMSKAHPLVAILAWLSNLVYRQADRIVVLGPYMADRIRDKGVRNSRIVEIPVWSRLDEIYPISRDGHPMRASLGLTDKFVVMYSGNLGLAHSATEFIEAARRLRHRSEIVFLFIGSGPRLREVKSAKHSENLENIRFLDYVPREQLHESLTVADVHLVSMLPEMTGIVVPGKLYGAMASERPVIFVGPDHCETADTIRQAGCGYTIRLGEVDTLVDVIEHLADHPSQVLDMGQMGRLAFLAEYERARCCESWAELLRVILGEQSPASTPHKPAVISLTR